jgi:hypothetical protein
LDAFELWVLCHDLEVHAALLKMDLPELRLVQIFELEAADPDIGPARRGRSRVEYYFTCTPSWILHVLKEQAEGEIVTYVDADIFFFSDPSPLAREVDGHSILIA